jgi:hypothetical protein
MKKTFLPMPHRNRYGRALALLSIILASAAAFADVDPAQDLSPTDSTGDVVLVPIGDAANAGDTAGVAPATPVVATVPDGMLYPGSTVQIPGYVPMVVAGFLPSRDTNVGIGISYPSGSSDFVYLVAGIRPPGGDPRLPALPDTAPKEAFVPEQSLVSYEPAEPGSGAIMRRVNQAETIRDFPPGTFLRRSLAEPSRVPPRMEPISARTAPVAVPPPMGGRILYPEPWTTETGEELIRNFPPGTTLLREAVQPAR